MFGLNLTNKINSHSFEFVDRGSETKIQVGVQGLNRTWLICGAVEGTTTTGVSSLCLQSPPGIVMAWLSWLWAHFCVSYVAHTGVMSRDK